MDINLIVSEIIGTDLCIHGYSDLTGLLPDRYAACPYAIVIAMKLDDAVMDGVSPGGPTREYMELYARVNLRLAEIADRIAEEINSRGAGAVAVKPTVADSELDDDYYKTLTMDFSHKMAATRVGMGWIGKTDLFISEEFGPRLRLATVLTDLELPVSKEPCTESRCGSCSLCVDSCPAHAANGKSWSVNVHRDVFYDPFKCREMCRTLSKRNLNEEISICGICVAVCPWGRKKG